jgi:hypothetical protein
MKRLRRNRTSSSNYPEVDVILILKLGSITPHKDLLQASLSGHGYNIVRGVPGIKFKESPVMSVIVAVSRSL